MNSFSITLISFLVILAACEKEQVSSNRLAQAPQSGNNIETKAEETPTEVDPTPVPDPSSPTPSPTESPSPEPSDSPSPTPPPHDPNKSYIWFPTYPELFEFASPPAFEPYEGTYEFTSSKVNSTSCSEGGLVNIQKPSDKFKLTLGSRVSDGNVFVKSYLCEEADPTKFCTNKNYGSFEGLYRLDLRIVWLGTELLSYGTIYGSGKCELSSGISVYAFDPATQTFNYTSYGYKRSINVPTMQDCTNESNRYRDNAALIRSEMTCSSRTQIIMTRKSSL